LQQEDKSILLINLQSIDQKESQLLFLEEQEVEKPKDISEELQDFQDLLLSHMLDQREESLKEQEEEEHQEDIELNFR
jgi:hypothetical protein